MNDCGAILAVTLPNAILTQDIITFKLLLFFLKQKWYKLCVAYGSTVQSSVHSIQIPKLYSQQNLWHQMRDIRQVLIYVAFFILKKFCRNVAPK